LSRAFVDVRGLELHGVKILHPGGGPSTWPGMGLEPKRHRPTLGLGTLVRRSEPFDRWPAQPAPEPAVGASALGDVRQRFFRPGDRCGPPLPEKTDFVLIAGYGLSPHFMGSLLRQARAGVPVVGIAGNGTNLDLLAGLNRHANVDILPFASLPMKDSDGSKVLYHPKVCITGELSAGSQQEGRAIRAILGSRNFDTQLSVERYDHEWSLHGGPALEVLQNVLAQFRDLSGREPPSDLLSKLPPFEPLHAPGSSGGSGGQPSVEIIFSFGHSKRNIEPRSYSQERLRERALLGKDIAIKWSDLVNQDRIDEDALAALTLCAENGGKVRVVQKAEDVKTLSRFGKLVDKLDGLGVRMVPPDGNALRDGCLEVVLRELKLAAKRKEHVDIAQNFLTHPSVLSALVQAHRNGAKVRVLLDDNPHNLPAFSTCAYAGIEARLLPNLHLKLFIFGRGERARVGSGSANFSVRGLQRNVEALAVVRREDVADEASAFFDSIWRKSQRVGACQNIPEDQRVHLFPMSSPQQALSKTVFLVLQSFATRAKPSDHGHLLILNAQAMRLGEDGTATPLGEPFVACIQQGLDPLGRNNYLNSATFKQLWLKVRTNRDSYLMNARPMAEVMGRGSNGFVAYCEDLAGKCAKEGLGLVVAGFNVGSTLRYVQDALGRDGPRTGPGAPYSIHAVHTDITELAGKVFPSDKVLDLARLKQRFGLAGSLNDSEGRLASTTEILRCLLDQIASSSRVAGLTPTIQDCLGLDRVQFLGPTSLRLGPGSKDRVAGRILFNDEGKLALQGRDLQTRRILDVRILAASEKRQALRLEVTVEPGPNWELEKVEGWIPLGSVRFVTPGPAYYRLREEGTALDAPTVLDP
jgi:hypothetical protein